MTCMPSLDSVHSYIMPVHLQVLSPNHHVCTLEAVLDHRVPLRSQLYIKAVSISNKFLSHTYKKNQTQNIRLNFYMKHFSISCTMNNGYFLFNLSMCVSHLCGAIWSDTLPITCPASTPLCIITGANASVQHHHGVCQHHNADCTQHCCQEQFHW
jgi:hypothetical protein